MILNRMILNRKSDNLVREMAFLFVFICVNFYNIIVKNFNIYNNNNVYDTVFIYKFL